MERIDDTRATTLPAGMAAESRPRASWPLVVLAVLATLAALYVARDVLIPIVVALLLALLLRPIMRRMQGLKLPDLLSAFLLVALAAGVFVGGIYLLAGQAQYWLAEAPQTIRQVSQMIPKRPGPIDDLQKTSKAVEELTQSDAAAKPVPVKVHSDDAAYAILGVSGHFLGSAVIVFVLAFFLLGFSDTLLRQAIGSRSKFNEKRNIVELVPNIENGISRYLLTITAINIGLGIATALAMWVLGMPNAILWGVMAATLNYVPHVGAFACMVVLFFVGAVSHESLAYGGLAAGAFVILTSVESYFVTPMILSKSLQLSPLAVILAILFCGWLWGIAGGLIAAPLLAILKVVCDQFDSLQTWAAFLAGEVPSIKTNGSATMSLDACQTQSAE
jgi:predicted PurR-regulated permease PerM